MTPPGGEPSAPQLVFEPNYTLDPETMQAMEQQIIADARQISDNGVVAVWMDPTHELSNLFRSYEAQFFPEVAEGVDEYYENHQQYLAVVDTRGEGSIAQIATLMPFDDPADHPGDSEAAQRTGFYTIDSLVDLENFTVDEFLEYYRSRGVDLDACVSVETNLKTSIKTGKKMEDYHDLKAADLVYLTLFYKLIDQQAPVDGTLIFATISPDQIGSFERNGIPFEPLMGRSDFVTEEAAEGKESVPVTIKFKAGFDIFSNVDMRLPELTYTTDKN